MLRANLAIGIGTYTNANYLAELRVLKNINEANVGIKLTKLIIYGWMPKLCPLISEVKMQSVKITGY